jgi:hypothetical protein
MADGSRKKSGAQHPGSLGSFECVVHGAVTNDLIYMVMRLYWPKTQNPSVLPPGKGTWSPPAIVKIN